MQVRGTTSFEEAKGVSARAVPSQYDLHTITEHRSTPAPQSRAAEVRPA
jgi:hypothetical protein